MPDAEEPAQHIPDPSDEACPDFAGTAYVPARQLMAQVGISVDDMVKAMRDGWQVEHDQKMLAWQQEQADQDTTEGECQCKKAEADARLAEEKCLREEEQRAMDKKKPKLTRMVANQAPPEVIQGRISEYARDKLSKLGFVEMNYFTAKVKKEVSLYMKTVADDTMVMVREDSESIYNFVPVAAGRAQKVHPNADL
ncbi:hypothetical protein DAEQUDRAFT_767647 [Daedalea quercina L-15889]|uniref:Uncharacterized protein n=1 Tax=Daedalea quercina L-15889 TaxID=1314783 RepID=A0A165NCX7_9APHY|nr:hypothetical protein DAEQUDRAFT_767647 [Daedalea quercina L-15889]